jgi:maleate isomerase
MSKRVGVIIPSTNTAVEPELYRHLPADVSVHTARMHFSNQPGGQDSMLDEHLPKAVTDIATMKPDVVLFACTSAGASRGAEFEASLMDEIAGKTGAPTISVMAAVVDELKERGAKKVGVLTPYPESSNVAIKRALNEAGFEVPVIEGLGITDGFAIAEVTTKRLIDFGHEVLKDQDVDTVFVSCTNLFTLDALDELSDAFGKPVMSSMSASLNAVERELEAPVGSKS